MTLNWRGTNVSVGNVIPSECGVAFDQFSLRANGPLKINKQTKMGSSYREILEGRKVKDTDHK
jgi:hypothetical protein